MLRPRLPSHSLHHCLSALRVPTGQHMFHWPKALLPISPGSGYRQGLLGSGLDRRVTLVQVLSGSWGGGGWHKASVFGCVPLAAPIGLSPLHIQTLCGPERVLVVSTEPPDDLSCLTTPGVGRPGDGAVACAVVGGGGGGRTQCPPLLQGGPRAVFRCQRYRPQESTGAEGTQRSTGAKEAQRNADSHVTALHFGPQCLPLFGGPPRRQGLCHHCSSPQDCSGGAVYIMRGVGMTLGWIAV